MKTNDESFFTESLDPRHEARALALEVTSRLLLWMADAPSIEDRGHFTDKSDAEVQTRRFVSARNAAVVEV